MAYDRKQDPTRAGVPIELDRPRVVLYNAFAFIEYDAEIGRDMIADSDALARAYAKFEGRAEAAEERIRSGELKLPMATIRDMLWAGLLEDDPTLTRRDVASLFTLRDLHRITEVIFLALRKALPERPERPTQAEMTTKIESNGSGPVSEESSEINLVPISISESPQ